MKNAVQITTQVMATRQDEVRVRTVVVVSRENGLRSTHEEVRWVKHFGDSLATSQEVHDRLTASMQKWVETGIKNPDLLEYGLE
jgi:hypothetical protein